jgi:GntR family transcriptional regulator / MocR family aminotransferase
MLPFKSLIEIDRVSKTPIYQQITNQFINLIKKGILHPNQKIVSSRELSQLLIVHRKTIVMAYDELILQGWFESKTGSGTFVAKNLPEIKPQKFEEKTVFINNKAGFEFEKKGFLIVNALKATDKLHLDDGFPDPRLAPLNELASAYKRNLINGNSYTKLGYGDTKGSKWLREQLAIYLNETRGLKINFENILITRGTMMGFYLAVNAFIKTNDFVVMGELNWTSAKMNLMNQGANILTIEVDKNGIVIDELEQLCEKYPIRMVYVTPHHDYPTTVTLKADRRIKLLKLAQKYRFIIFEDDYDYDFHYQSRPLLPLASADESGLVLYTGSFTKSISPAFRVGYLVAPEEVVEHLAYFRRIIDRQGDFVLENAIAELMQEGIIQKHLKKSMKEYRIRRDFFCDLLNVKLKNEINFEIPEGGMSVWTKFVEGIDLVKTTEKSLKNGLFFSDGLQNGKINSTRLGFASSNLTELEKCTQILKQNIVYS